MKNKLGTSGLLSKFQTLSTVQKGVAIGVGILLIYIFYKLVMMTFEGFTCGTNDNMTENFESSEKAVVLFYAPWCGACKRSMPVWNEVESRHKGKGDLVMEKVNCDEDKERANKYGIEHYPTLMMIKNGQKAATFELPFTVENLEKFISEQ